MENKINKHLKVITQVGIIVHDLEKAVKGMKRVFGVDPDDYGQTPPNGKLYYGEKEDFSAKMAFYRFANVDIELIEPQCGRNIWQDFLDNGQRGLHHIRFSVDNLEGTIQDMKERGIGISMEGESVAKKGYNWAYFDTEEALDYVIEIFNEYEDVSKE
jgi:catechol 2,3-dioxygenase-like lactoylglutathione lyase family enzyme